MRKVAKQASRVPGDVVRISGHDIVVEDRPGMAELGIARGVGKVEMSQDLLPGEYHATLLHELLHLVGVDFGVPELRDDRVVGPLSMAVLSLIRDNPELIKRIQAGV